MKTENLVPAAAVTAASGADAQSPADAFLARLRQVPADASAPAPWVGAREFGAPIVPDLAAMLADPALSQNSARALRDIVLHAGRPDAPREMRAVERQLLAAISKSEGQPRQDLIRVLSEIGGDRSVPLLTQLLANPETWESARYALIRIPGRKSLAALKAAWADAEGEARFALAEALRARGSETGATPKLTPTCGTEVKPKAGKSA